MSDDHHLLKAGFESFLLQRYSSVLQDILLEKDNCSPRNIHVDSLHLTAVMPRLVNALFSRPRAIFPLLDDAAVSAQDRFFHSSRFQALREARGDRHKPLGSVKRTVRVRVDLHRISCPGFSPAVSQVRKRHAGRVLSLSGTVMRVSAVKSHEVEHLMECTKCKHRFLISVSKEDDDLPVLPSTCPSSQVPFDGATRSVSFVALLFAQFRRASNSVRLPRVAPTGTFGAN